MLTDLRRATQYEVQVRARTQAGYGSFSPAIVFRTLPDGKMFLFALAKKKLSLLFFPFPLRFFFSSYQQSQSLDCVCYAFIACEIVSLLLTQILVMSHLLHRGKLCGLAFAPITF